jgi:hypothetical protein
MTSVPYMQFQPPPRPVAKFPRLPRLEVTHQRTRYSSFSLVPIAAKSHYMYILDACDPHRPHRARACAMRAAGAPRRQPSYHQKLPANSSSVALTSSALGARGPVTFCR